MNLKDFEYIYEYELNNKCTVSVESCDLAQFLKYVKDLERYKRVVELLHSKLETDACHYWLPEWSVSPDSETKPSFEEFIKALEVHNDSN